MTARTIAATFNSRREGITSFISIPRFKVCISCLHDRPISRRIGVDGSIVVMSGYEVRSDTSRKVSAPANSRILQTARSRAILVAGWVDASAAPKAPGFDLWECGTTRIIASSIAGRLIEQPQQTDDGSIAILLRNVRGGFPIRVSEIAIRARFRQKAHDR